MKAGNDEVESNSDSDQPFQLQEINELANKLSVSANVVTRAIAAVGNKRSAVRREVVRIRGSLRVPRARANMMF